MYNKVILIGRLTKDPEMTLSQQQVAVVRFSLAVNRRFQSKDGVEDVDFINCVAFRTTAEMLSKYMKKGSLIQVEGRLQQRKYTTESGENRISYDVICDNVLFLESKKMRQDLNTQNSSNQDGDYQGSNNFTDDDLPF